MQLKVKIQCLCLTFLRIVTHNWSEWKQRTGQDHVDIITFYNEIFIPSVKPLLVELGPAGPTPKSDRIPEVNNKNEGTCLFVKSLSIAYLTSITMPILWSIDFCGLLFPGHLAQCPGSPKISPFPTLPDMSPKKVSATHNVYVSPLRSSKVLIYLFGFLLRTRWFPSFYC